MNTATQIRPEPPRLETEVAVLLDVTDCDMTDRTTTLSVTAIRFGGDQHAHVYVDDRGYEQCLMRLLPDEARRVAAALTVAADEADKLDRVKLDAAGGAQ